MVATEAATSVRDINVVLGEAERLHDVATLKELLHDALVFRRADGHVAFKEQFLAELHARHYDRLDSSVIAVDERGDSAVVAVEVTAEGRMGERPFGGTYLDTRLFVREDGHWRCRAWLNTRLAPAPEHPLAGRLHHVSLPAIDLDRSRAFYRDVLGLREIARPPFDFPGAWFAVGDGQLHLIVHEQATVRGTKGLDTRDMHFAMRVPSFRRALEHLRARGYSDHALPNADPLRRMKVRSAATAGHPQIFILDPAHNVIELNADQLDE